MKTKFELDKRVLPTLCVLLTAMWLPLTTFAQDLPRTYDHARATHGSADFRNCQHPIDSPAFQPGANPGISDKGVGFTETDPSRQDALQTLTTAQPSAARMQQALAGFGETDPAYQRSVHGSAVSATSADRTQQTFVGFAEADPAKNAYRSVEEAQNLHLVVCPHANVKSVVYAASESCALSGRRYCHNHS